MFLLCVLVCWGFSCVFTPPDLARHAAAHFRLSALTPCRKCRWDLFLSHKHTPEPGIRCCRGSFFFPEGGESRGFALLCVTSKRRSRVWSLFPCAFHFLCCLFFLAALASRCAALSCVVALSSFVGVTGPHAQCPLCALSRLASCFLRAEVASLSLCSVAPVLLFRSQFRSFHAHLGSVILRSVLKILPFPCFLSFPSRVFSLFRPLETRKFSFLLSFMFTRVIPYPLAVALPLALSNTGGLPCLCVCVVFSLSLPSVLVPVQGGGSSLAWLSYAPSQPTGKLGGVPRGPNSRGTRPLPYLANSYSNFNVDVYMGPDHKENAGTPIFCVTPSGTRTHHSALRSTLDVAILTLLWFTLTVDSRCIRPSFHRPSSRPLPPP